MIFFVFPRGIGQAWLLWLHQDDDGGRPSGAMEIIHGIRLGGSSGLQSVCYCIYKPVSLHGPRIFSDQSYCNLSLYQDHTASPFRTQPSPHTRFVWIHHHLFLLLSLPLLLLLLLLLPISLFSPLPSIAPSGRISRCLHRLFYPSHNYSCCHSLRGTCNYLGVPVFLNSRDRPRNRESFLSVA